MSGMEAVKKYDLAIAWNWEYDQAFIDLIQNTAFQNNISILKICTDNVEDTYVKLKQGAIEFRFFLDRASDEDETFQPLARHILNQYRSGDNNAPRPINPHDLQIHAADKATMHLEFLTHGIEVPYTIIVSPYNHKQEIELTLTELAKLGRPFIIKPANTTGGGIGVVMGAETLKEVVDARQFHKNDKYLLQETIRPIEHAGRRAWFRVFYAFGIVIPCWWDDVTHVYAQINEKEEQSLGLAPLRTITERIHTICKLEFFSTELVCTFNERCVAVDYVNEMCDMRLQSQSPDGVPDTVVQQIVSQMIRYIQFHN